MPKVMISPSNWKEILTKRRALGQDHKDEVWDGVYFMAPDPTNSHQSITLDLFYMNQREKGREDVLNYIFFFFLLPFLSLTVLVVVRLNFASFLPTYFRLFVRLVIKYTNPMQSSGNSLISLLL